MTHERDHQAAGVCPQAAQPAQAEPQPVAWRDHVEKRIRGWRQRTMNRSGDRLALDDMMGQDSIDDLIDYVCDEWAEPSAPTPAQPAAEAPAPNDERRLHWPQVVAYKGGDGGLGPWVDISTGDGPEAITRFHAAEAPARVALPADLIDYMRQHLKHQRELIAGFEALGNEVRRAVKLDGWIAALEGTERAPARVAPQTLRVAVHECPDCGHIDVNDDNDQAACNACEWSGPSQKKDHCPGCGKDGTMTTACPECGHRTNLLAERDLPIGAAPARVAPTDAARDVLAERQRQVSVEGWTPEHDDEHRTGGMAVAAACYAAWSMPSRPASEVVAVMWPWTGWSHQWFKPKDTRHNLIRAGALLLAEIERLDRAAGIQSGTDGGQAHG